MYEVFEHTADLGIRVASDSFVGLLTEAAVGLTSVLVDDPASVRSTRQIDVEIPGNDPEDLLVDWLAELLWRFSAEHMLFSRFEIIQHDDHISAHIRGETFDGTRHRLDTEVKAITYHRLKVEHDTQGWRAEVIVDL